MDELGLCAVQPKRTIFTTDSRHSFPRYPNLVLGLEITHPDQVWVGDITYIRLPREFVYLAILMDVFTRAIRGWHLGRSLDHTLSLAALERALVVAVPEIHHSDQGVQYAASGYVERLLALGVRPSMAAAGKPEENPFAERVIRAILGRILGVRNRFRIFLDSCLLSFHHIAMGRPRRTQIGGIAYHILNRANARTAIFHEPGDYAAFLRVLAQAQVEHPMRLLFYCLMPNHWRLVLWPEHDGLLARFIGWLTLTHTQRWHAQRGTAGCGHLYQGRYKSFPVETDDHLLTLGRYVERNALRAGLVERAESWPWGSLWQRVHGGLEIHPKIAATPVALPDQWTDLVKAPKTEAEE
jgi:putative transposase